MSLIDFILISCKDCAGQGQVQGKYIEGPFQMSYKKKQSMDTSYKIPQPIDIVLWCETCFGTGSVIDYNKYKQIKEEHHLHMDTHRLDIEIDNYIFNSTIESDNSEYNYEA